MPLKQAIVVRTDLGMSQGKTIAQACHASLGAYRKVDERSRSSWEEEGAKKVVLDPGEREIVEIHEDAKRRGIPVFLVQDAGMTELEPGTKTAVGIGPAEENEIDTVTGELRPI